MRKITIYVMAAVLSIAFMPTQSFAASTTSEVTSVSATGDATEASGLVKRLDEINSTNRSGMSFSEKQGLRKEVRSIKSRLSVIGGGVYFSAGAIILIVLLLIILL